MKQTLKPRSLARVILALAIVISILVGSSFAIIRITKNRLKNYAESMAEQQSAYVNVVTNMTFIAGDWIINSFMAGFADIQPVSDFTVSNIKPSRYIISDKTISRLATDEVFDRLLSFMTYHSDYSAAVMIFEPGVLRDAPDGLAAKVFHNDSVRHNLFNEGFTLDHHFYRLVRDSDKIISSAGFVQQDSLFVSTVGLPFYDTRGRLIGQFWIDTDADTYSDLLNFCKSDVDVVSALIDEDCRIIASTNKEKNGQYVKTVTMNASGGNFPTLWYDQVLKCVKSHKRGHFRYEFNDDHVVTYIFPIANTPYRLLLIKPESRLYSHVERFIWFPIVIFIACILMVSLCLTYLFFVIKHNNDETTRMESELNIAAELQRSILPPNPDFSHLSSSPEPTANNCQLSIVNCQLNNLLPPFDIYGFQRPAKTVGGDLYDFVRKGDLLHFCIGDVSGKGMPAALVMAEICSLYRYVISHCSDPADIVSRINNAAMERSDDTMLCTLFVGVLDLRTGLLQFCNAGHNPPIFIPGNESSVLSPQSRYLAVKPNILINAFRDYDYRPETLQLNPGDRLCLYTDGVTEAKNAANRFYGTEATLASAERYGSLPFAKMVDGILSDLKAFTRKAEQHDDITLLCIEYLGCNSLHFDSVKGRVTEIVDRIVESCQMEDDFKFRLAIEEPVQNVADYAYQEDGPLDVGINRDTQNATLEITIVDSGKPFNPLEISAPDLTVPIQDRQVGGLGIFLTRKVMNEVNYRYEDNKNILSLKYKI